MKHNQLRALFVSFLLSHYAFSQYYDAEKWEETISVIIGQEELSTFEGENLMNFLEELHENPLNINVADREELSVLPFLSASQIESIHAYIYYHGPLLSLGELQLIDGMDYTTRKLLMNFVYIGSKEEKEREKIKLNEVLKYGKQELSARMDVPLYRRAGFKSHTEEELKRYPNRQYLGPCLSHSIRYSFRWHDKIRFGMTADQDAGETFFVMNNSGYDFYSFFFMLKDVGRLNELIVGNIKTGFGKGLLLNSDLSMGKSLMSAEGGAGGSVFRPHYSTAESGFFRGIGVSVKVGEHGKASVLLSYTPLDATINSEGDISSFKTDGYHRTPLEWNKKHNVHESLALLNYTWHNNGIKIGVTSLEALYDRKFKTEGSSFYGVGTDYSIGRPKKCFSGETAISSSGALATLNSLSLRPLSGMRLRAVYRYYSPDYQMFHSNSFSEGGISNEEGLLLGADFSSGSFMEKFYVDCIRFPRARYGVSGPSRGFDTRLMFLWMKGKDDEYNLSFRYKAKQADSKSGGMEYKKTFRFGFKWSHLFEPSLELRSRLDYVRLGFKGGEAEEGWAVSGDLKWNPSDRFSVFPFFSYFNTDSYACAISVYESGLRYAFNLCSLYGNGIRLAVTMNYSFTNGLSARMKFSMTDYFDRSEIGSSQQLINASHKEDLFFQLHYTF